MLISWETEIDLSTGMGRIQIQIQIQIDEMFDVFGIDRSLSRKGRPYDNAVDKSTNKMPKAELVYRETFGTTRELQVKLADYVHWRNNFRIHSTLGYMTPVEFGKTGLVLPRSSRKM